MFAQVLTQTSEVLTGTQPASASSASFRLSVSLKPNSCIQMVLWWLAELTPAARSARQDASDYPETRSRAASCRRRWWRKLKAARYDQNQNQNQPGFTPCTAGRTGVKLSICFIWLQPGVLLVGRSRTCWVSGVSEFPALILMKNLSSEAPDLQSTTKALSQLQITIMEPNQISNNPPLSIWRPLRPPPPSGPLLQQVGLDALTVDSLQDKLLKLRTDSTFLRVSRITFIVPQRETLN